MLRQNIFPRRQCLSVPRIRKVNAKPPGADLSLQYLLIFPRLANIILLKWKRCCLAPNIPFLNALRRSTGHQRYVSLHLVSRWKHFHKPLWHDIYSPPTLLAMNSHEEVAASIALENPPSDKCNISGAWKLSSFFLIQCNLGTFDEFV